MNKDLIEELFQKPAQDFLEHLDIPNNERIIFSGRFGMGKTTFLRDYFFNGGGKMFSLSTAEKYNVFHLFPVNYSIAQNEDIFRYIKYDILLELLKQEINVESIDLRFTDTLPFFVKNRLLEVAATLLTMVPHVGKELGDSAGKIVALIERFKTFHADTKLKANTADVLDDYIKRIEATHGSIYEQDIITNIIEKELSKLKRQVNDEEGEKLNVLIIDDLDRIDPEHIFRIMNVFAAHFDNNYKHLKNKLAFDKIILVCDINNV